ncbi:MAG: hypothetical protein Kow0077_18020 [Anaerolineae bacterium]
MTRFVGFVLVAAVLLMVAAPVIAQSSGRTAGISLEDEVGGMIWRVWCRTRARMIAELLDEEVGCYLWRCWCKSEAMKAL